MTGLRAAMFATLRAMRAMARRPRAVAAAATAIAIALVLVGFARLVDRNATAVTEGWGGGVQMVVYLDDGADDAVAQRISGVLAELPAVERVRYVPRGEALERLRSALGDRDDVVEAIDPGMLPASLEVTLASGVRDVAAAHPVVARLEATAGVEEVELLGEWVDRATALIGDVRSAGGALFALVAIAGLCLVLATVRAATPHPTRQAEIVSLLGGSPRFSRAPMLISGATLGLIGAALAATALWALFAAGAPAVESTLAQAFGSGPLEFLPARELLLLGAAGVALGTLGAALAPGRRAHA